MKKILKAQVLVLAIAFVLAMVSCASYRPLAAHDSFPQRCVVLGRVSYTAEVGKKAGFTQLIEEAKKQYPDADDVVHIMIDEKKSGGSVSYVMTGIVVKYSN